MKKLPARTMHFALPLALTFIMTFFVSGVATIRAIGLAADMQMFRRFGEPVAEDEDDE